MLPGGTLSNHGYTRKWGFFNGICAGAGHQPFELSKDRIAGAVADVEKTIAEVEARIAELENLDSETNGKAEAWNHTYKQSGIYTWEKVPVSNLTSRTYSEGGSTHYSAEITVTSWRNPQQPKQESIQAYDAAWKLPTIRHWVHFLNCKFAKSLRQDNSGRRDWVRWQQGRMENWAPKALKPRTEKAKVVA